MATDLENIKKELKEVSEACLKMSKHIDFVENTYDNVKKPFHYIIDKVNSTLSLDDGE